MALTDDYTYRLRFIVYAYLYCTMPIFNIDT